MISQLIDRGGGIDRDGAEGPNCLVELAVPPHMVFRGEYGASASWALTWFGSEIDGHDAPLVWSLR